MPVISGKEAAMKNLMLIGTVAVLVGYVVGFGTTDKPPPFPTEAVFDKLNLSEGGIRRTLKVVATRLDDEPNPPVRSVLSEPTKGANQFELYGTINGKPFAVYGEIPCR